MKSLQLSTPPHTLRPADKQALSSSVLVVTTPHTHTASKLIIAALPVLHHFPHCSNSRSGPKVSVVRAFLLFNDVICGIKEKKIYISNVALENSKTPNNNKKTKSKI